MNGATNCASQSTEGRSDPPVKPTSEVAHQPGQQPAALFDLGPDDVADTSDDWYTPPWLFKAAGLTFDMDVAAPVNPARRTCPALAYLTPVEDGLTHPWSGVVWCNPPYSGPAPWVARFARHPTGLLLVPAVRSRWLGSVVAAADALALVSCEFTRPDGSKVSPGGMALVLAARGVECASALARVAAMDTIANGAFLEQISEPSPAARESLL